MPAAPSTFSSMRSGDVASEKAQILRRSEKTALKNKRTMDASAGAPACWAAQKEDFTVSKNAAPAEEEATKPQKTANAATTVNSEHNKDALVTNREEEGTAAEHSPRQSSDITPSDADGGDLLWVERSPAEEDEHTTQRRRGRGPAIPQGFFISASCEERIESQMQSSAYTSALSQWDLSRFHRLKKHNEQQILAEAVSGENALKPICHFSLLGVCRLANCENIHLD